MWLVALLALLAHPNSISSTRIYVNSVTGTAHVELRFEGRTVAELLPIDLDQDGRLSAEEVSAAKPSVEKYLTAHYSVTAGGQRPDDGLRLASHFKSLRIDPQSLGSELASTWLIAKLEYTGIPSTADLLWVSSALFLETSPDHRNFTRFDGPPTSSWVFSAADPLWLIDLPRARSSTSHSSILPWVRLGFDHIRSGVDHLFFVLGILLAAGGWRRLAFAITSFTLAHSLSLGLAALGVIPSGGYWTEVLIAASIVFVGAANLAAGTPRRIWPEAFLFGLIHGLGFASALGAALGQSAPGSSPIGPLFGFNLGIEIGQLGAALMGAFALKIAAKKLGSGEQLARLGSMVVVLLGAGWLALRLFT